MAQPPTDRNLLFGILALQMDFISRDALIQAMHAWVLEKAKPLGQILLEQGALIAEHHALLEALVQAHLRLHHDDPEKSLAAVSSIGSVREQLNQIADPELHASLAHVSAAPAEADPYATRPPAAGTATSLGTRFRILRPHRKGGLGEVFVAHDQELHREVALKEIQDRHADDPDSRSRFVLEAEITGRLEHPGVVPVYGLGQYADGRPFYAMRFVRGDSLHDALERFHRAGGLSGPPGERLLELRQLLGRFLDVCNAVAFAHARGVLHRDLKPGNILLGPYGETLVVDWGLAKPLDRAEGVSGEAEAPLRPASGSSSTPTEMGTAIGTPAYMSPEQAAGQLDRLGPASDVYSLGATLYVLLTDRPPFEGSDRGAVLERVHKGDFARPRAVAGQVPRALEAVCLKAMALRPEDRYGSPRALADDLEHWLADEPVSAYREPWPARVGRWSRRHKSLVASAAALVVTAAGALAVSTVVVSRQQAATQAAKEQADQNFRLARKAVDDTITKVAETKRLKEADFHLLRKELLSSAVPFYEEFVQQKRDDPKLEAERGAAYYRLAVVREEMGEREQAVRDYIQMRSIFERLTGSFPKEAAYRSPLARSHHNLALLLKSLGQGAEAEASYRAGLHIQEQLVQDFPGVTEYCQDLAYSHSNLSVLLEALGRRGEATESCSAALRIRERLVHDYPNVPAYFQELASSHNNLAILLEAQGKRAEAETSYRGGLRIQERLVKTFPAVPDYRQDLAISYCNLGVLQSESERHPEAEASFRAALPIREQLVRDFPTVPVYRQELAQNHCNLGVQLSAQGKRSEAEAWYRAALQIQDQLVRDFPTTPVYRQELATSHNNRGNLLGDLGKSTEAEAAYRAGLQIRERLVQEFPSAPRYAADLAGSYGNLGHLLRDRGQLEVALAWYAKSIRALTGVLRSDKHLAKPREFLGIAHWGRADALARLGRYREALADWDRAVEFYEGSERNDLLLERGMTQAQTGQVDKAVAVAKALVQGKDASGATLYGAAGVYALASKAIESNARQAERYADRAMALLRQAQAAGHFRDADRMAHLKQNSAFVPLHSRAAYQKFLAELEKAIQPGKARH
jgi:serine/threonine-protein kinase